MKQSFTQTPYHLVRQYHCVRPHLQTLTLGATRQGYDFSRSVTLRIFVSYTGVDCLNDVTVTVAAPAWTSNATPSIVVPGLSGMSRTPIAVQCALTARSSIPPSSMNVKVSASFVKGDVPRYSSIGFRLPMCLACRIVVPPVRESMYKLTIQTDKEAVSNNTGLIDVLDINCPSGLAKHNIQGHALTADWEYRLRRVHCHFICLLVF